MAKITKLTPYNSMRSKHKLICELIKVCSEYDDSLNPHPNDDPCYYYEEMQKKAILYVPNKLLEKWIKETKKKIN